MIQVSGYFYDATTNNKISDYGLYTIASMKGYGYNIAEALLSLQVAQGLEDVNQWAATQYIVDSPAGKISDTYTVSLPDVGIGPVQVPVTGRYSEYNFNFDDSNILYWLHLLFYGIYHKSNEVHNIRFCRRDNHDIYYLEYNPIDSPSVLKLKVDEDSEILTINNIVTFENDGAVGTGKNPYLFTYSRTVSELNDNSFPFFLGVLNLTSMFSYASIYKADASLFQPFSCSLPIYTEPKVTVNQSFKLSSRTNTYSTETIIPGGTFNYYYIALIISRRNESSYWSVQSYFFSPFPTQDLLMLKLTDSYEGWHDRVSQFIKRTPDTYGFWWEYHRICANSSDYIYSTQTPFILQDIEPIYTDQKIKTPTDALNFLATNYNFVPAQIVPVNFREPLYTYLSYSVEPESEISPTDIPPADEPTDPAQPDIQDPYYDPTSDPKSPQYDPTKDPKSPSYDPSVPHTPYRPVSQPEYHEPPVQTPQDDIPLPPTPPSYITNNKMFTLYNPSGGDLNNVATFLWSSGWSVDAFKKIFANPIQCILGLMVLPQLSATVSTKELTFGNIPSGINLHYFESQFFDFDCGSFDVKEYYASYLDYSPYTKVSIFLPFIGDHELDVDEVMNKTITVKYRFDLASGDCVAFIFVGSSVHYQFSGNCAARLPIGASSSNALSSLFSLFSMAASVPAGLPALGAASAIAVTSMKQKISHSGSISGSAGLMGVLTPYLIITRPRQAYPMNQNVYTGYPAFITESLSQLTGYTEVEQVHLEHVPATGEELVELERLLKEGVLF